MGTGQLAEGPLAPAGWASRGGHPWLPAGLALAPGSTQSQAVGAAPFSGCQQVPTRPSQPQVSEGSGNPHGSCSELRTPSPGSMGSSEKEGRGHQRTLGQGQREEAGFAGLGLASRGGNQLA